MAKSTKLSKFIAEVANEEGGKSQVKIGDVRQILKIIDKKLAGIVYAAINLRPESK